MERIPCTTPAREIAGTDAPPHLIHPLLHEGLLWFVLAASALTIYDERERDGHLRHAVIRSGADGEVLVAIVTTSTPGLRDVGPKFVPRFRWRSATTQG